MLLKGRIMSCSFTALWLKKKSTKNHLSTTTSKWWLSFGVGIHEKGWGYFYTNYRKWKMPMLKWLYIAPQQLCFVVLVTMEGHFCTWVSPSTLSKVKDGCHLFTWKWVLLCVNIETWLCCAPCITFWLEAWGNWEMAFYIYAHCLY